MKKRSSKDTARLNESISEYYCEIHEMKRELKEVDLKISSYREIKKRISDLKLQNEKLGWFSRIQKYSEYKRIKGEIEKSKSDIILEDIDGLIRQKDWLESRIETWKVILRSAEEEFAKAQKNEEIEGDKINKKKAAKQLKLDIKNELHNRSELLAKAFDKHKSLLKIKFAQNVKYNDYGKLIEDSRFLEFLTFLKSNKFNFHSKLKDIFLDKFNSTRFIRNPRRILNDYFNKQPLGKRLETRQAFQNGDARQYKSKYFLGSERIIDEYENFIKELNRESKKNHKIGFDPDSLPMDGFHFETWVAENLKHFGWDAKPTQGTGDQGIDVIAVYKNKRVGIQCKLYSGTVGNKAVQEVVAGVGYYKLDCGVVITNAEYTKSAIRLAESVNVPLLKHTNIPDLIEILGL